MACLFAYLVGPHTMDLPLCFSAPTHDPSQNLLTPMLGGLHPLLEGRGDVVSSDVGDLKRTNMVSTQREHTVEWGDDSIDGRHVVFIIRRIPRTREEPTKDGVDVNGLGDLSFISCPRCRARPWIDVDMEYIQI